MKKILFLLVSFITPHMLFATDVTVQVKKAMAEKGGIIYMTICNKASFENKKKKQDCIGKAKQTMTAKKSEYTFVFKNITPGEYAISGFQDVDKNGEMNTNWIGMPKEPVFFAVELHGPPSFYAVKSVIEGKKQTIIVNGKDF